MLDTASSTQLQQTHCRAQLSPSAKWHLWENVSKGKLMHRGETRVGSVKQPCRHQGSAKEQGEEVLQVLKHRLPLQPVERTMPEQILCTAAHRGLHFRTGGYFMKERPPVERTVTGTEGKHKEDGAAERICTTAQRQPSFPIPCPAGQGKVEESGIMN